jgi:hypothetical protein
MTQISSPTEVGVLSRSFVATRAGALVCCTMSAEVSQPWRAQAGPSITFEMAPLTHGQREVM